MSALPSSSGKSSVEGPEPGDRSGLACGACGVISAAGARFCRRCGKDLSFAERVAPPAETTREDGERSWGRVASVLRFGGILLASSIVAMIAVRCGAPTVPVELALTLFDAAVVARYAIEARQLLRPLLRAPRRLSSAMGDVLLCGLALAVFAPLYFGTMSRLGVEMLRYSDAYLARGWPVWGIFAIVSLAPAIVEETAFRGVMMERLDRVASTREALLIQASLFAVLHLSPVVFPSHFVIGLLLGWLRLRTRSLYPGMVVHAAYNAVIVALEL